MSTERPAGPPAGWYPDPEMADTQRYWDGSAWSDHVAPASPAATSSRDHPAAWYPHPSKTGYLRWYDGENWTEHVSVEGSGEVLRDSEVETPFVLSWDTIADLQETASRNAALGQRDQQSQIICQFCGQQGCVTTRRVARAKRKTATRIVGAVATMGGSLPLTGVSKKGKVIEMSCSNCGMTWDVGTP